MSGLAVDLHIVTCPSCKGDIDASGLPVGSTITCPHCNHDFELTRTFSHYLLQKEIGAGGMGAVFLGKDLNLDRVVAIKVLKTELGGDVKFINTFMHEAKITASLNHPNIVQVYKFDRENDTFYLVMEHIPGGTLDDRITKFGGVTELEGLEIGIAVASGLDFAHQRGLIHRDIKPGNILFDQNNIPKVVDFGLSLSFDTRDQFEGEIWGTPYYVAPEKLERKPEDWRSDLYSLGTTLFHAISGRPPYDAEDPTEVAMKHLTGAVLSIKAYAPAVSNQTAFAIQKAIARQPDDRYTSYQEFIAQLEDAKRRLLHGASSSQPITVVTQPESSKSSLWMVIVAIVLTILLVIGGVVALMGGKNSTTALDDFGVPTPKVEPPPKPEAPPQSTAPPKSATPSPKPAPSKPAPSTAKTDKVFELRQSGATILEEPSLVSNVTNSAQVGGFQGKNYLMLEPKSWAEFHVNNPANGKTKYELTIRFANGEKESKALSVSVNGKTLGVLDIPVTGSLGLANMWGRTPPIAITLGEGLNTIRLTDSSKSKPLRIDEIVIK
jgi:serine/threonine protein kinase